MKEKFKLVDAKFSQLEEKAHIMRDGPLDMNRYIDAQIKILWLLKQEYYGSGASECDYSKRVKDCIQRVGISSSSTWRRISYVSYGILTGQRDFNTFPDANVCAETLFETAVVEANKEFGDSSSPDSVISEGFVRYEQLVHLQLDAYQPDIVIVCLPESLRGVVNSLYSHCYGRDFENGPRNIYLDGADVGVSRGVNPVFLWPYHPQATRGYNGEGISDDAYTTSLLRAYDSVVDANGKPNKTDRGNG